MKQILHIFVKDTRRFWPEILISLSTLAVVMYSAHHWLIPPPPFPDSFGHLDYQSWENLQNSNRQWTAMLSALVPIAWWLLIARVIHAESPVGDRQFWLTRPYSWKNLLAAKLLFLVVFLYLPFVAAQSVFLISVKLNPLASIPGMLFNLAFVTAILVMPVLAIATVTSSLVSMALTILGVALGIGALASAFNDARILTGFLSPNSLSMPVGDHLNFAFLVIAFCGIVIVLQYFLRRAWLSRVVLFGTPVALAILSVAVPNLLYASHLWTRSNANPDTAAIKRTYPPTAAGATAPLQLAYDLDERHQPMALPYWSDKVQINIPLALSGMTEGTAVNYDQILVTFEAADGSRWSATMPNIVYPSLILANSRERGAEFNMPLAEYNKFKSIPSTVTITLLLTELKETKITRAPMPTDDVQVPNFGACVPAGAMLYCRTAFRPPQFTRIAHEWVEARCNARTARFEQQGWYDWVGNFSIEPAEFGIVPAHPSRIDMLQYDHYKDHAEDTDWKERLCSGKSVTLTQYKIVGRTQVSLKLPNFQLPALRWSPQIKK